MGLTAKYSGSRLACIAEIAPAIARIWTRGMASCHFAPSSGTTVRATAATPRPAGRHLEQAAFTVWRCESACVLTRVSYCKVINRETIVCAHRRFRLRRNLNGRVEEHKAIDRTGELRGLFACGEDISVAVDSLMRSAPSLWSVAP